MTSFTLRRLAAALRSRETSSRVLSEACLKAIDNPDGEGRRAFPYGPSPRLLDDALGQDALRDEGRSPSPFAGLPISLKDNIDQAGEITRAGSRLLQTGEPAEVDAPVVARLRAAGLVVVGRTAMTEFAFSGLGLNAHHGTPLNPYSLDLPRIPGGSSAGAAVSVATGMAYAAIGTDTGGSCRIPAAFCGLAGWKPTSGRVPVDGIFPLSPTLDCVGVIGGTADCCAILDAVMAGRPLPNPAPPAHLGGFRLAALTGLAVENLDPAVSRAYAEALDRLRSAGVRIEQLEVPALGRVAQINALGGFSAIELYRRLEKRLATDGDQLDPRVLRRVQSGAGRTDADLLGLQRARSELIAEVSPALDAFDAVVTPTTPFVAPTFVELELDASYDLINLEALRNTCIANMLDRPSITLPCHAPQELPVGFMLMGRSGSDVALLDLARAVEPHVAGAVNPHETRCPG